MLWRHVSVRGTYTLGQQQPAAVAFIGRRATGRHASLFRILSSQIPLLWNLCRAHTQSSAKLLRGDHHLGWLTARSTCQGSIAECLTGDEFDMDSEINRRILATRQYISYGALKRNSVPCSRRGASYYNCQPGAQANPYKRGCSAITRCRR
ncbi:hypothetical protein HHK36_022944 [Tetracentron sinense]|uniref:Uncharacterized protein n=1 Tax=Tetracentron sinense TaxID=13715 RepID=A0A835D6J0_TETSI|nr:hypothetical protein HHK36_022944 [Tetracentron sinense]